MLIGIRIKNYEKNYQDFKFTIQISTSRLVSITVFSCLLGQANRFALNGFHHNIIEVNFPPLWDFCFLQFSQIKFSWNINGREEVTYDTINSWCHLNAHSYNFHLCGPHAFIVAGLRVNIMEFIYLFCSPSVVSLTKISQKLTHFSTLASPMSIGYHGLK